MYKKGMKLITHLYSCTSTITRKDGFRRLGVIETAYLIDDIDVSVQFEYEDDKNVYQAVLSLPDNLKSVIYLYYFEELSAKEIGNILKIRESTVFMRLSRGRALLKERLGSDYDL